MPDIEIKRGFDVLPDNNVRFGIRVMNNSDFAISDVEVLLDYNDSLFELSGNKVHKLGTIPPAVPRTAKFILKPLGCIHKENIGATIIYKDHQWKKHIAEMRSKEVHCVCPFLKEKSIKRADFLTLSKSGFFEEHGVNFEGITVEKLVEFISHTCKNRLYKVDEFQIENGKIIYLAGDALGEKAYYLLTAVVKEYEGLAQVLLRASSDKKYGLNGFLNEILDNLRHLVVSASAREIGVIKKEQVINIIDSVVQRTTFSGGEGEASVNIKDSVVQRTEFKGDEERKRREEERRNKEREEQERLQIQKEEEDLALREKENEERQRREEEAKRQRQEEERQRKAMEVEERGRKAREDREKQRKLDAENNEREMQKQRAEQERQRRQNEEIEHIQREKEEERARRERETKSSRNKFFTIIILIGILALGWYVTQGLINSDTKSVTNMIQSTPTSSVTMTSTSIQANKIMMIDLSADEYSNVTTLNFNYEKWGRYKLIHSKGKKYFVGYQKGEISDKDISLLDSNLLSKVLIDNGTKKVFIEGATLSLEEGYALRTESIDVYNGKAQLILLKDGTTVYSTTAFSGGTYAYSKNLGNVSNVPIIAIRLDSVFRGREVAAVFIEGIFQISETPLSANPPSMVTPISSSSSITKGLVAEYHFDGDAKDSSGNGNDGTIYGATFVNGVAGKALSFNGVDNYVDAGESISLKITEDQFTLMSWIYATGSAGPSNIIINKEGEYELGVTKGSLSGDVKDNSIWWAVANANPGWDGRNTNYAINLNEWYFVVMIYDGSSIKTYINGILIHSLAASGAIGDNQIGDTFNKNKLWIGWRQNQNTNAFKGLIDEVRIYNHALSSEEIKQLYDEVKTK